MHGSAESFYDHDLEKMAHQVIDTKILGKGVKTFGGDLTAQPWRSFKFVWMSYVGAVSPDMRTHLKEVETQPDGTTITRKPDGSSVRTEPDAGIQVVTSPDGQQTRRSSISQRAVHGGTVLLVTW